LDVGCGSGLSFDQLIAGVGASVKTKATPNGFSPNTLAAKLAACNANWRRLVRIFSEAFALA
jgi:hypothetical protein